MTTTELSLIRSQTRRDKDLSCIINQENYIIDERKGNNFGADVQN